MDQVFSSVSFPKGFFTRLFRSLQDSFAAIWGPVADSDGVCRLQMIQDPAQFVPGALCRLPLKKLLLPTREPIWSWQAGHYEPSPAPERHAVLGLPLCELQGAWYLDRVFAEDPGYRQRRDRLFLVGSECRPGDRCRCRQSLPVAGDLFLGEDRLWLLSQQAEPLLAGLEMEFSELEPRPLPFSEPPATPVSELSRENFQALRLAEVWQREGHKCLSCGACSAVCPTCYCFDLRDTAGLDGRVIRTRDWDNCFFAEHGLVAGGHDFRPDRPARLRFRLEHKMFGFGELRGLSSCVGCGRCRDVCPVGIDLDHVVETLQEEARR